MTVIFSYTEILTLKNGKLKSLKSCLSEYYTDNNYIEYFNKCFKKRAR